MRHTRTRFCVVALTALLLAGCSKSEIEEYSTSKSEFATKPSPPGHAGQSTSPMAPEEPHWTLPDGWKQLPGSGIRFATLLVDEGMPPLELRVTPLSMAARDPLANVNRWAVQIGLEGYAPDQLDKVMHTIDVEGRSIEMFRLVGPPSADGSAAQEILSAIVPGDENVWFFMIMGDHERVKETESDFEQFMRSVHLRHAPEKGAPMAAMPPDDDVHAGMMPSGSSMGMPSGSSSGADGMTWTLPEHWTQQPDNSQMRIATFKAEHGGHTAEVTITKFPGDVGGMLPNLNRWRRQLGMPAIASLDEQPLQSRTVAGVAATFVDLVVDPQDPTAQRMFVVLLPYDGMTWFLKMVGPSRFLEEQMGSYDAFVSSVGFSGGTPGE